MNHNLLKEWLNKPKLSQTNSLLIILLYLQKPCRAKEIVECAVGAGLAKIKKWKNMRARLNQLRDDGHATELPEGWEILPAGKEHLLGLGVPIDAQPLAVAAKNLRILLKKIPDVTTRAFVKEAIECCEFKLNRSAVVMSWLVAIDVLRRYVLADAKRLADFNAEAKKRNPKWKPAKKADDFAYMKEAVFLDILRAMQIIDSKGMKDELDGCLKLRNSCGHPSSLQITDTRVESHIENLVLYVFEKFP